jgi:hypothetical protein
MGQELVNVLSEIVRDGLATEEGFRRLQQWLGERPDGQLPAMDFLSRVVGERASKPEFTTRDLFELQFAVERVLPHPLRDRVAAKRQWAWWKARATENQVESLHNLGGTPAAGMTKEEAPALIEQLQPRPTEKQLDYIRDLGGTAPPGISGGQASDLIDRLLAEAEARPTPQQIMVLRFWNRMDLANSPKHQVAEWLEQFYKDDPRRKLAWEMFKLEGGDDGSHHDPSTVPIGAGESYLEGVAQLRHAPETTAGGNLPVEERFAAIQATIDGAGVSIQGQPEVPNELCIETLPPPAETEERFCKCPCGGCGVNIEFPVHGIGQTVSCPKCGSDILLFDSSQKGLSRRLESELPT